jgi:hypothetical protein
MAGQVPPYACVTRSPKMAEPTRTWVAPKEIAFSKSALMPIDRPERPLRSAILASSAKCRLASSSTGGMHISPLSGRSSARNSATNASTSAGRHAGLLRFLPGVDLDEDLGAFPPLLRQPRERLGEFRAVHRVDGVEHLDRGAGLVGLKRADQVQLDPVVTGLELGPAALRLLHAILAEDAVPFAQDGLDPVGWLHLGHRDQRHVILCAAGLRQGGGDAFPYVLERHGADPS